MTWFVLSLLTAFFQGLKDLAIRRGSLRSGGGGEPLVLAWGYSLLTGLLLLPAALLQGVPDLAPAFWVSLASTSVLLVFANLYYFKALHASDLSLTSPMLTFTPLFLLLTSPVMLGEFPRPGGLLGMLLIVAGSYLLRISQWRGGLLAPFRALLAEPGPRHMLLVALVWSVSANIDKSGVLGSSPLFWGSIVNLTVGGLMTLPALRRLRRCPGECGGFLPSARTIGLTGAAEAASMACQMYALTMAIVPYVISVKRTSVVFGVILGGLVLREEAILERLVGAAIMVAGVFLIAVG